MPGHKRGAGCPWQFSKVFGKEVMRNDTTELPPLDNLQCATGVLQEAQALCAAAWGAQQSFFLVNGTTVGTQAAVWSLVSGPEDKVLLQRNAHKSGIASLIISGASPVFLAPAYDDELQTAVSVTAAGVAAAFAEHPGIAVVLITRPTYEGHCADVAAIAAVCRAHGAALVVDEAHGAHLAFGCGLTPRPALEMGADIVVQSVHKTLSALTQASLLHVAKGACARVSADRIQSCLNLLQTSSPSYVLMASLDAARAQVTASGGEGSGVGGGAGGPVAGGPVARAARLAMNAAAAIAALPGLSVFGTEGYGATQDPTRLTVVVRGLGLSGFTAKQLLYDAHGLAPELASPNAVSFIVSVGNTQRDLDRVVAAFARLSTEHAARAERSAPSFPQETAPCLLPSALLVSVPVVAPRVVFRAAQEKVPLALAVGRVAAELVCPYPPGIPVLLPGECVGADAAAYVAAVRAVGCRVAGLDAQGRVSVLAIDPRGGTPN